MEKINQFLHLNINDKYKKENLNLCKNDPDIISFFNANDLDLNSYDGPLTNLLEYIDSKNKCKNCLGLNSCQQNFTGYHASLCIVDSKIELEKKICNYALEKMAYDKKKLLLYHNVSNNIFNINLSGIDKNDDRKYLLANILDIIKSPKNKGIYLYGAAGIGKSYIFMALLNALIDKYQKPCAFISYPDFVIELKMAMNDNDRFKAMIDKLKYVEVLVLDDVGAENISSWNRDEILFPILNYRMSSNLLTFMTSNKSLEELEKSYSITKNSDEPLKAKRLLERIKTLMNEVYLVGNNRRY